MNANRLLVVVPAFNEAERVAATVQAIREQCDADIVVVDDGSDDETAATAGEAGAVVLRLPFNLGYGAAVQTGFCWAVRRGYERVVQMDADGQHDPSDIEALVTALNDGSDVAIGSRFLGAEHYAMPLVKRIGSRLFGLIAALLTRRRVSDPTSGFQALSHRALQVYASDAYPSDFPDADVIIMVHRARLAFTEVPVTMKPSPKSKSMHSGLVPLYYVFKMCLSILVTLMRREPSEGES